MKHLIWVFGFSLAIASTYGQSKGVELSHYIFPEFTQGTVLMKSGLEYKALLNYNSFTGEMIFDKNDKKLAIGKEDKLRVDTVYIMKRKFFIMEDKFVELLYNSGFELYAEHMCNVKYPGKPAPYGGTTESTSVTTYSGIYSGGVMYELKLPDGYTIKPYTNYWLKRDGEPKRFVNMKQLTKLFDDKKDLIKEYLSTRDVEYEDQESLVQLLKYLESN
ncbi:MAG: hypothetical protein P1P83_13495 [Bacteroidales bacterium]|nr:hypothetical protein [Bacteroidales bacterium]MDT8374446.1 hypothetical protein [Bacteroidales bacterium]